MKIKVHRGLEQIGGCITEISTATSRVFIDMGQNLPGNAEKTTPEQDKEMVKGFFRKKPKEHEAVIYTHAHEDHVGMFVHVPENVPQYIGEGGRAILLAKYRTLLKAENVVDVASINEKIRRLEAFHVWEKPKTRPRTFRIGDIVAVCKSYM